MMEIREAVHPEHARGFDTAELRKHFLVTDLFRPGRYKLVYSGYDRLIVGGVCPERTLELNVDKKIIGSQYLLERREMGIINVGGPGAVTVDGKKFELGPRDGLYVGLGARQLEFGSAAAGKPAKFYFNCAPAHTAYPAARVGLADAERTALGAPERCNQRTICKFIHPNGIKSCQLVMGLTLLPPNSVWNTMPPHTHGRRIEAYFYFDLPADGLVFQILGEPSETRHVVVRNEEAVLHPSWSIHSGVGTVNYSFIWGMAGENQTFSDMDDVPPAALR